MWSSNSQLIEKSLLQVLPFESCTSREAEALGFVNPLEQQSYCVRERIHVMHFNK